MESLPGSYIYHAPIVQLFEWLLWAPSSFMFGHCEPHLKLAGLLSVILCWGVLYDHYFKSFGLKNLCLFKRKANDAYPLELRLRCMLKSQSEVYSFVDLIRLPESSQLLFLAFSVSLLNWTVAAWVRPMTAKEATAAATVEKRIVKKICRRVIQSMNL